jgi:hypothetical protein
MQLGKHPHQDFLCLIQVRNTSNVAFQVSNYYNNGNGGVGISGSSSGSNSIGVQGSSNTGTGVKGSSILQELVFLEHQTMESEDTSSSLSGLALQTGTGGTEINGALKITSGSPETEKVLTSDANGNATWQENYSNTYLLIAKNQLTRSSKIVIMVLYNLIIMAVFSKTINITFPKMAIIILM